MSPVRAVYVPCFSSQPGSSQRDGPQPDHPRDRTTQTGALSRYRMGVRGNKRGHVDVRGGKTRFLLKVKLQKLNSTLNKKEDNTPRRWMEKPANKTKTTVSRPGAATDSDSVGGDIFFFSQRPTSTAINHKNKAKLAVLRTISKMLEENKLIRQRLATISQAD